MWLMFHRLVNGSISRWRHLFSRLLDQQAVSESGIIMVSALVVGAGSGLGAVFFRWLIETVQTLAYEGLASRLQNISPFYLLIVPAIGGAIYGPLIYRFAREAKGHGVPEVMEAVALQGGRIRPRVAVIKSLASAICIGTGGSVGREGPIAQIGAGFGSFLATTFKLSDRDRRIMMAAGIGAGVGSLCVLVGTYIFRLAQGRGWIGEIWMQVTVPALAMTCFAASQALGGSGFIACFVGGLLFGGLERQRKHKLMLAAEGTGDTLALLTWVAFGTAVVGQSIGAFSWQVVVYALRFARL